MVKYTRRSKHGIYPKQGDKSKHAILAHDLSDDELNQLISSKEFREKVSENAQKRGNPIMTPGGLMDPKFVIKLCGLGRAGHAGVQVGGYAGGKKIDASTLHHEQFVIIDETTGDAIAAGDVDKARKEGKILGTIKETVSCVVNADTGKLYDASTQEETKEILDQYNIELQKKHESEMVRKQIRAQSQWLTKRRKGYRGGSTLGSHVAGNPTKNYKWASKVLKGAESKNIEKLATKIGEHIELDHDLLNKEGGAGDKYEELNKKQKETSIKIANSNPDFIDTAIPSSALVHLARNITQEKDQSLKRKLQRQFRSYLKHQITRDAKLAGLPASTVPHGETIVSAHGDFKGRRKGHAPQGENESIEDYKIRVQAKTRTRIIPGFEGITAIETCLRCGGNVGYNKDGKDFTEIEGLRDIGMSKIDMDAQIIPRVGGRTKRQIKYNVNLTDKPRASDHLRTFIDNSRVGPDLYQWDKGVYKKSPPQVQEHMGRFCNACETDKKYVKSVPAPYDITHPRFGKIKKDEPLWVWTEKLLNDLSSAKLKVRDPPKRDAKMTMKRYSFVDKQGRERKTGYYPVSEQGRKAPLGQGKFRCSQCKGYQGRKEAFPSPGYVLGRTKASNNMCQTCMISIATGETTVRTKAERI